MIKLLFDWANLITSLGLILGTSSIILSINSHFILAMLTMLVAVCCDVFDGMVARKFREKKSNFQDKLGVQLDSLADLIHSGVAPGVFVYTILDSNDLFTLSLVFYIVFCCFLRLAYFNCVGLNDKGFFYGLPVFYSPMILSITFLINISLNSNIFFYIFSLIVPTLMVITSLRVKKLTQGLAFYLFTVVLLSLVTIYGFMMF
ncbi:CDP-alcohol phosphatidyltransferase family protein [Priestia megaterium]|uniref:CDP-alcohol phosphatidyltransferase family protein n=1 Tax=Priestia megaterium TaxID=1404 RepID=UPI003396302B